MSTRTQAMGTQHGIMLLDVLIAILIFAVSVLGLVGLNAKAVAASGDSKYRADATLLANDLLAQMQISARSFSELDAAFSSTKKGDAYLLWQARVRAALPGASSYEQSVSLTEVAPLPALLGGGSTGAANDLSSSTHVEIWLRWLPPAASTADGSRSVKIISQVK